MKQCTRCKETKPLEDFSLSDKDRRKSICKTCINTYSKERRKQRKEAGNVIRTCTWCQKEIKPAEKANRIQRNANVPASLYHSPCMGKYLRTLKEIATLLD